MGYLVCAVSRNPEFPLADLCLQADFSNPSSIEHVFARCEKQLGVPNVVIFNAFSWNSMGTSNPLEADVEGFQRDLNINTVSAFAAMKAAVKEFGKLGPEIKKTFLFTGNKGNTLICPQLGLLALTKSATWYLIQTILASYSPEEETTKPRFYFVDERSPNGKGIYFISGAAHAKFFLELAERVDQGPPLATFVRGVGYKKFEEDEVCFLPVRKMEEITDSEYGVDDKEKEIQQGIGKGRDRVYWVKGAEQADGGKV